MAIQLTNQEIYEMYQDIERKNSEIFADAVQLQTRGYADSASNALSIYEQCEEARINFLKKHGHIVIDFMQSN